MARPKSTVPTSKTYIQRFHQFEAGICPYCHAEGATLAPATSKKDKVKRYRGYCRKCRAENNFSSRSIGVIDS